MIWAIALPTAQADAAARKRCHTNTHSFARGDLPGVGKVFSATLDALVWCRRGRRVVGPVRPDYDHKQYKGGTAGLFYKWEGWEARNRIPYSYRHKGLGSGLKLKGKAVWRGCLDPFKAVCPVELYIAMNLYLHYDGTCFAKATFHNGATGKRSNALHDTNC